MASQLTEPHIYHPQDALGAAVKATALTGGFGLFASAVQNTLAKENVGSLGIFFRTGSTIAIFGTTYPQLLNQTALKTYGLTVESCMG